MISPPTSLPNLLSNRSLLVGIHHPHMNLDPLTVKLCFAGEGEIWESSEDVVERASDGAEHWGERDAEGERDEGRERGERSRG